VTGVIILELLTILVMLGLASLQWRAGLFQALLLFLNVFLAGLLAFNFWEPLARSLSTHSPRLDPYADALWLSILFAVFLILFRLATLYLAPNAVAFPRRVQQVGGAFFGLLTGYLAAGLCLCVLQTLPLPERFLGYDPAAGMGLGSPERIWLALMRRASGEVFDGAGDRERWFDVDASFIPRYARYRRIREGRLEPFTNQGEFPAVLSTKPPIGPEADSR
jgi:hypothetical protein